MTSSNGGGSVAPELGILGTGRMGSRLATMFAQAGRNVILGSRDPARAEWIAANAGFKGLRGGSYDEALEAPAVLPAIFIRDGLPMLIEGWRDRLAGKLLIDITNPYNDDYSDFLTPWDGSGAEELRNRVPEARIVGAYKNVWSEVFAAPDFDGVVSDVLVVGDDPQAKADFLRLAEGTPFRYLDAGPLIFARTVERLTLMTGRLGRQLGTYPQMNWRLLGQAPASPAS